MELKILSHGCAAIALSLGIAACSGGGSSTPASQAPSAETPPEVEETPVNVVSGKVADGYLVGALVCMDLNGNKNCDEDEPQATSTAGGEYELDLPDDMDATLYSVVVIVPPEAIDEDTNEQVGGEYVLTAPAGKPEFVSPITTIIQTQIESNPGMSADEAEASVKSDLGYEADDDVDLFQDYVEAKDDEEEENAEEYDRIHKIAQVAARALERNLDAVETAAENSDLDIEEVKDELIRIVVKEVIEQLSEIQSAVDSSGEEFDADDVSENVDVAVDTSNLEDDVANEEALSESNVETMAAILGGGVNHVDDFSDDDAGIVLFSYGRIGLNESNTALEQLDYIYNPFEDDFVLDSFFNHIRIALGENGWMMDAEAGYSFELDDDGSAIVESPLEGRFRVFGSSVDISGRNVRRFLLGERSAWAAAMPEDLVFSENSRAYRWTFTQLSEVYSLDFFAGFEGICFQNAADGTLVTAEQFGGNCNTVWSSSSNAPAQTLDELFVGDDAEGFHGRLWLDERVGVRLIANPEQDSGTAQFLAADNSIEAEGEWQRVIVAGVTMLEIPLPINLRGSLRDNQASKRIFAVHDGFVRNGIYIAAGSIDVEDEWNFNDTAMQDMLDNFTPPSRDQEEAESASENGDGTDGSNDDGSADTGEEGNDNGQDPGTDSGEDGSGAQDDGTGEQQDDGTSQPG